MIGFEKLRKVSVFGNAMCLERGEVGTFEECEFENKWDAKTMQYVKYYSIIIIVNVWCDDSGIRDHDETIILNIYIHHYSIHQKHTYPLLLLLLPPTTKTTKNTILFITLPRPAKSMQPNGVLVDVMAWLWEHFIYFLSYTCLQQNITILNFIFNRQIWYNTWIHQTVNLFLCYLLLCAH